MLAPYKHREALQEQLFGLGQTITLYDLTHTCFDGVAAGVSKARRGHRKDGFAKVCSDCPLKLQRVLDAQGQVLLYCHSPAQKEKDRATDTQGKRVTAISWVKRIKPGTAAAHPGAYCLRTTPLDQDNATLWRTCIMLSELESVFRSLKTDLGLRPVFHPIDRRVEGHFFISVLAYHFVHTLRQALATQRRVTVTMQRRDGRAVHVRKATRPQPRHQTLGTILKLDPNPGRTHRVMVRGGRRCRLLRPA